MCQMNYAIFPTERFVVRLVGTWLITRKDRTYQQKGPMGEGVLGVLFFSLFPLHLLYVFATAYFTLCFTIWRGTWMRITL